MAGPATTYTNLGLITGAYVLIGVIDQSGTPDGPQGTVGLSTLNDMLAAWAADGVFLGWYPQTSLTATAPLLAADVQAVMTSLALRLSAKFGGLGVNQQLIDQQDEDYAKLAKRYQQYTESASELPREQAVIDRTGQNL